MRQRYFDSAATTRPKAPAYRRPRRTFWTGYAATSAAATTRAPTTRKMWRWRCGRSSVRFWAGRPPRNVIFTPGCTHSLNYVVKGLLEPGDRAAVSTMEHNAVLRPLKQMERWGVAVDYLPCSRQGELLLEQVEGCLTERTRLVVLTHASNVCGTRMPIEAVGKLCRERGIFFWCGRRPERRAAPHRYGRHVYRRAGLPCP